MTILILVLATLTWLATWLVISKRLRHPKQPTISLNILNSLWLSSLVLHSLLFITPWLKQGSITITFLSSLSIVMWFTCLLLFLTHLKRPLETLGLFIIPVTTLSLLLATLSPTPPNLTVHRNGLGIHILISLLAYSMLALATLQALLLATQNHHLHNHQTNTLIRTLPPLQDMESLLFQLIQAGVLLLTLGLLSGFIFLDDLFAQHVAHKTLLSILAWITFATLLFGHWRYGWRGRIAIRWTVSGFTLLMLAFWGSKFVREYLINPV